MRNQTLVFYHLPKTGGLSVWHGLVNSRPTKGYFDDIFSRLEGCWPGVAGHYDERHAAWALEKVYLNHFFLPEDGRLYVHHHDAFPVHSLIQGARYFCSIRSPPQRLLSQIRHMVRQGPKFIEYIEDVSERTILEYVVSKLSKNYYRRWFSALFAENFAEAMKMHAGEADLLPDDELLERIEREFVAIMVMEERTGFSEETVASMRQLLGTDAFDPAQVYQDTVTDKNALDTSFQQRLLTIATDSLQEEISFYHSLVRLSHEKANRILRGEESRSEGRLAPSMVPEDVVQRMLHEKYAEYALALAEKDRLVGEAQARHANET